MAVDLPTPPVQAVDSRGYPGSETGARSCEVCAIG